MRERILMAALRSFGDQGYDGTSTSTIATAAGVSQPMVAYYFRSKDALWRATVENLFAEVRAVFEGIANELRDIDGRAVLKVLIRRFVIFSARRPELARLMMREGALPGPRLKWMVRHHLREQFSLIERLVRAGVREGWAKDLPVEQIVFLVVGAAAHLSAVSAMARELYGLDTAAPATIEVQADTLIELVFHGLSKESRGRRP